MLGDDINTMKTIFALNLNLNQAVEQHGYTFKTEKSQEADN